MMDWDSEEKQITIFRRDLNKKIVIPEKDVLKTIGKISKEFTKNLIKEADKIFKGKIKDAKNINEVKKIIKDGAIARCLFCSVDKNGETCAEKIEKETGAEVRGTKLDEKETSSGKCVVCGKTADEIVYVARSYWKPY